MEKPIGFSTTKICGRAGLNRRMAPLFSLAPLALLLSCVLGAAPSGARAAGPLTEPGDEPFEIGIRERPGGLVPLDITFTGEDGAGAALVELITKPTIVAMAYYGCTNVCPELLMGVADVVGRSETAPGRDYTILTVSFDPFDTPEAAQRKKADYLKAASASGRTVPADGWRFLTGTGESIERLAEALGFGFERAEGEGGGPGGFLHPAALVVLSEEGRIIRYLHGTRFFPFDIDMALSEATRGEIGPTIPRLARLCFTYDPERRTYAFSFLRVGGGVILLLAGGLAFFVVRAGRKRKGGGGGGGKGA